MNQFAYYTFLTNNMLNTEKRESKDEIIKLTEEVPDVRGIECDFRISRFPSDESKEILEEVSRKHKKINKRTIIKKSSSSNTEAVEEEINIR